MRRIPAVLALSGVASAGDFVGQASVIDGDTLEIHGTRIRLLGDRCTGKTASYAAARTALDTTAARWPQTTSTPSSPGQLCSEWLVRNGLALDWPQYSKGKYGEAQRDAERLGRGIWKGSYVEPWLYRTCIRLGGTATNCSDDANAHP